MSVPAIITAILIYLLIGYLLRTAFQDAKDHSFITTLFYPIAFLFLCVLTIIIIIFDGSADNTSEYTVQ